MALGINLFLVPYKIVPGGVTGVAMLINYLAPGISIGILIIIINVPLFVLCWRLVGRRFLYGTILGTFISSIIIDATAPFLPKIDTEPLLAAIFGGLIMGVGLGLIFSRDATTGGTDIVARLMKLVFRHMQMGKLILIVDAVVIIAAAFTYNSLNSMFYAVISLYVCTVALDFILYGTDFAKVAYIISDKADEIKEAIFTALDRGVTILNGEGGFTGEPRKLILCAIKRTQIARLKETVKDIDPNAFIILTEAHEVLGEGFRDYDKNAM